MTTLLIPVTIKVTLVFCAAWGVSRAMARRTAAARHLVWTIALMSALTIPLVQAAAPRWNLSILPSEQPVATSVARADGIAAAAMPVPETGSGAPDEAIAPGRTSARAVSWSWLLTRVWLAGVGFFLFRLVTGMVWAAFITRRAAPVTDPEWMATLDAARGALGVTAGVRLRYCARTTIPVACGVMRPTVLLPSDADSWSEERRRVVLFHELAHVKRRDCLVQSVAHAARALHWFNPAAHLAIARLHTEQELACDDVVLASGAGEAVYANHLVEIAQAFRRSAFPLWATAAMARPSQLEGRVRAILDLGRNRQLPGRRMRAVAAAACAVILPLGALGLSAAPAAVALVQAAAQTPAPAQPPSQASRPAPPAPPRAPIAAIPPQAPAPPPLPSTGSAISDDTRRRVADALMAALTDENVDVRQQALFSLAEMRDPRAIPGFIKALGDSNSEIRQVAVNALTELATPENTETIVPALIPLLKDPQADVRAQAVRALGQMARARKRSVTPPNPPQVPNLPQVNLHLDSLQDAVDRAQAEAQWQIERLWNGRSPGDSGNR